MHELGIVSGILETVSRAAHDAGALRVVAVTLRIGDMREVVPETLDFAWNVLSEDDELMRGSELRVEEVHPRSRCLACGEEFEHSRFHVRCPACGSAETHLLAGRELEIVSMEVDLP